MFQRRNRSGIFAVLAFVAVLHLASAAWGQIEERGQFEVTGNVGAGYSSTSTNAVSESGPAVMGNADVAGYYRDPRILYYNVDPFYGAGSSYASQSEVGNRGKGLGASAVALSSSAYPFMVDYSLLSQDAPAVGSSTGNVLASQSTSFFTQNLGVNGGLFLRHLPSFSYGYSTGETRTDYSQVGNSDQKQSYWSCGTTYGVFGWQLDAAFARTQSNGTQVNLEQLTGGVTHEHAYSEDLHADASRFLPQSSSVNFTVGRRIWDDTTTTLLQNNSYDYARFSLGSHPVPWLTMRAQGDYNTNATAATIQQLLGGSSSGTVTATVLPVTAANAANGSLMGLAELPYGFTVSQGLTVGSFSTGAGELTGDTLVADTTLDYVRKLPRRGALSAGYSYGYGQTSVESETVTTTDNGFRAGLSYIFPYGILVNGEGHFDTRSELTDAQSSAVASPEHTYGFTLNVSRQITPRLKLSGDAEVNHNTTAYPIHFVNDTKSFGVLAEGQAWRLSTRLLIQSGLSVQVGSGVVYLNEQSLTETPLDTVLSNTSNNQFTVLGTYRPGKKRLSVDGSWTRFSYSSGGAQVEASQMINLFVSYRLRRLRVQAGYFSSKSQLTIANTPGFDQRQYYIGVVRRFRLF